MKKLFALAVSTLFILTGCATGTEFGEVSSAIKDSQEMQTEETQAESDSTQAFLEYECDSPDVDDYGRLHDELWQSYWPDCPVDKTSPTKALPLVELSTDAEACKVEDVSIPRQKYDSIAVGFPLLTKPWVRKAGTYKVLVVPIEFADVSGTYEVASYLQPQIDKFNAFYENFSRGQLAFDWVVYEEWITLPKNSTDFPQDEELSSQTHSAEHTAQKGDFYDVVIEVTDPIVDYSDADIVFFMLPTKKLPFIEFNINQGEGWYKGGPGGIETEEGKLWAVYAYGEGRAYNEFKDGVWVWWVHEVGHEFGLPDINWHSVTFRNYETIVGGSVSDYDIMAAWMGPDRILSTWSMFTMGWLPDSEVHCATPDTFVEGSYELFPASANTGQLSSLMFKLSETEMLVVESRRLSEFALDEAEDWRARQGVLVYHIDTTLGHGENFMTLLAPEGRKHVYIETPKNGIQANLDAILYEGNSISVAGLRIEVNSATSDRDMVSISKDASAVGTSNAICITPENADFSEFERWYCPLEVTDFGSQD